MARLRDERMSRQVATATLAVAAFVVLAAVAHAVLVGATERGCLAAGYTAGKVTLTLDRYCVARVDNSDVVLPLAEARRRPRR